jgi:hypothetical protein
MKDSQIKARFWQLEKTLDKVDPGVRCAAPGAKIGRPFWG